MRLTGAQLAVHALEQVGVRYTFGVPGVHNTEIYDHLDSSTSITPVLVTHELGAAFMADAISRTTDSIGCLVIVPAAGTTHAMSGIGEAYLDGIPMLVVTGGVRRDSGRAYQLHAIDQERLVAGLVKRSWVVSDHAAIVPTIYEAYDVATTGCPGPVFVEIPAELQLFSAEVAERPDYVDRRTRPAVDPAAIEAAVELLRGARRPGLLLGWGARDATAAAIRIADRLGAPVATSLQGLSVFPHDHPLHAGYGFGPTAVPAARKAFEGLDVLLTVGCRFGELATGSYSMPVPELLIHVDIDREVFDRNYPARVRIHADATDALPALADALAAAGVSRHAPSVPATIAREKAAFRDDWTRTKNEERVGPGRFFAALRAALDPDDYVAVDDGNHTFLAAEQFPVYRTKHLVSPTDFNAMGYCVPAAVAIGLAHPEQRTVGIVGDGAFLMTGMELLTATTLGIGPIVCVFNDGELAQISQLQQIPLNRKTCTVLGQVDYEGIARGVGATYVPMRNDDEIDSALETALAASTEGRPVLVDVHIDYSRKTCFTKGVVRSNLGRFPLREKVRFIGRALKRHVLD